MNEKAADGLKVNMVVDITTMGRKSGRPRRIEIWSHCFDGRLIIASSPGKKDWYANLVANPHFTYHVKGQSRRDVSAVARPITDEDERRAILLRLKALSTYWDKHVAVVDEWVQASCLVEVILK